MHHLSHEGGSALKGGGSAFGDGGFTFGGRGLSLERGDCIRGRLEIEGLHPGGLGRDPTRIYLGYSQQAGSTHPSGMHYCEGYFCTLTKCDGLRPTKLNVNSSHVLRDNTRVTLYQNLVH